MRLNLIKSVQTSALFLIPVLLMSCNRTALFDEVMVSAGSNRKELEAVLYHYRNVDNNPEKLHIAEFLIKNLPAHYSYSSSEIYEYYDYADIILADSSLTPEQKRDSLLLVTDLKYLSLPTCIVPDAQVIKADFLIDNIDKTYNQWKTCPWSSQLSFDDYLEWLLPYKAVELQELDQWRDTMLVFFKSGVEHSLKNDVEYNTTIGVAEIIRNEVSKRIKRHGLYTTAGLPLLSAHLQINQAFGNIPDYALTAVLAFRAAGVPAVLDETPVGARYTAATKWYVVYSDRGEELTSEWDISTMIGGAFFPYERGPKVYRNTYAINEDRKRYQREAKYVYPFDLGQKDVTSCYFLTSDLYLPIDKEVSKQLRDKYIYIASAVRDEKQPWKIVDFGILKHRTACFRDMGREVLYSILGFDGKKLVEITNPFILHKDGHIEYVCTDSINSPNYDIWKNNTL